MKNKDTLFTAVGILAGLALVVLLVLKFFTPIFDGLPLLFVLLLLGAVALSFWGGVYFMKQAGREDAEQPDGER